jgi:hypothetical protein
MEKFNMTDTNESRRAFAQWATSKDAPKDSENYNILAFHAGYIFGHADVIPRSVVQSLLTELQEKCAQIARQDYGRFVIDGDDVVRLIQQMRVEIGKPEKQQ